MAIRFWLNDRIVVEEEVSPTTTLLEYLRRHEHLTGTKEGCAEGDCGACTIAILDADGQDGPRWRAVNACLMFLPLLHERRVVTVEGLARDGVPHPAQKVLFEALGSQCGYCTPGVVMSLFEACYRTDLDAPWKLDDQMCGNLCRCTGYRPIRDAAKAVGGSQPPDAFATQLRKARPESRALTYERHGQRFFQPTTLDELYDLLQKHPDAKLVGGATDLGLDVTKKHVRFPTLVSTGSVPEMQGIRVKADGTTEVGAAVRLSDLEAAAEQDIAPLARMLRYFGSRQIKHNATLGGNLCNASPIGDLAPVLLALDAVALVASRRGSRKIPLASFFPAYRKTALEPGEVLVSVDIPPIPARSLAAAYKVSKRRELDISAVAAGMVVTVEDGQVTHARLGWGGMAATPSRSSRTEAALVGRPWTEETVREAAESLTQDFTPMSDHRGSAWYRATVAKNLLLGFYLETRDEPRPTLPAGHSGTVIPGGTP